MSSLSFARYDISQSYEWNYAHAPAPVDVETPAVAGDYTFLGRPVSSPLGMPAGPLLNGRWILYYASLGFDVLTYKTVRSVSRDCYPLPNLQPVKTGQLSGTETEIPVTREMDGSWAVSFGMPSKEPDSWRADVEWTRSQLASDKVLSVSVVGTAQPGWSLEDLADDYALCAKWAVKSGADCIETNFSCPNVSTRDGQLYQEPDAAAVVAERVRAAIGDTPFIIKIGHVVEEDAATALLDKVGSHINAIAGTNSVATTVRNEDGSLLFEGQCRGICRADAFVQRPDHEARSGHFADRRRWREHCRTRARVSGCRCRVRPHCDGRNDRSRLSDQHSPRPDCYKLTRLTPANEAETNRIVVGSSGL